MCICTYTYTYRGLIRSKHLGLSSTCVANNVNKGSDLVGVPVSHDSVHNTSLFICDI